MEDLAAIRRIKLEQCVQLATFQTDATQVSQEYVILCLFLKVSNCFILALSNGNQ